MMTMIKTAATVLSTLALLPTPATAGTCAPHDEVTARLAEFFGEYRQAIGLTGSGLMMEIFAASVTGTWTIVVTRPDGLACLVAAGEAFEATASPASAPLPGEDDS